MKQKKLFYSLLQPALALCTGLALTNPAWATGYTITDLGTLGGISSEALSINNAGWVVGSSTLANGNPDNGINASTHAFIYRNGAMHDLGVPGDSIASGINNSGKVVGWAGDSFQFNIARSSFLYDDGTSSKIGGWPADDIHSASQASAINNSGQIVGVFDILNEAYLYSNGSMNSISGMMFANGINDNGTVAGRSNTGNAAIYNNGILTDLGAFGGQWSNAVSINNNDQVVGTFTNANVTHSFLYDNGVMTDLGTLGGGYSNVRSINNYGQAVGSSKTSNPEGGYGAGFLYSGGTMLNLNYLLDPGSGWYLTSANDINDLGQIVGTGLINGQSHAFLMTPSSVPVPGAAWLFGSALLGLARRARRKYKVA